MPRSISYDVKFRASLDTSKISGAGSRVSNEIRQSAGSAGGTGKEAVQSAEAVNRAHQETLKTLRQQKQEFRDAITSHQKALNSYASTANTVRRSTEGLFPGVAKQATEASAKIRNLYGEFETLRRMIGKMKGGEVQAFESMLKGLEHNSFGIGSWMRNLQSDRLFKEVEKDKTKQNATSVAAQAKDVKILERDLKNAQDAALGLARGFARLGESGRDGMTKAKDLFKSIGYLKDDFAKGDVSEKFTRQFLDGFKKNGAALENELKQQQASAVDVMEKGGKKSGGAFMGSFKGALVGMATGMAVGFATDFVSGVVSQIVQSLAKGMEYERIVKSLGAVSVSKEETARQIADLKELSKNTPGLTFESALVGQQRLRAVNFGEAESKQLLEGLSKQKLLSGGTDDDVNRVLVNLQQVKSTGTATQREIKEILHALPTVADAMENAFGTTNARQIEALGVSGSKFIRMLNDEMAKTKGITGDTQDAWEKLVSQFYQSQKAFSDPALDSLINFFKDLTIALSENEEMFMRWGESLATVLDVLSVVVNKESVKALGSVIDTAVTVGTAGAFGSYGWATQGREFYKNNFGSPDAAEPTDADQEALKKARVDRRKYVEEQRDALSEAQREKEMILKRSADSTTEGERQLQIDLLGLKSKGFDDERQIVSDSYNRALEANKDNQTVTKTLKEQFEKDMNTLTRANELERTEIQRQQAELRIQLAVDEINKRFEVEQGTLSNQNALRTAQTEAMQRETLDQQRKFSAQSYQDRKKAVEDQLALDSRLRDENIEAGLDGIEQDRLFQMKKEKAENDLKILRIRREAQVREENLSAKRAFTSGGNLSGTSGNAQYDSFILEFSKKYNINPNLILAQMSQESSYNRKATSNKGASGLMQLMPGTARRFGVTDIYDPKQNIEAGVKYMRWLLNEFGGDVDLALAGYNAGEGAVKKYGGKIPPYKETQDYVKKIKGKFGKLQGTSPDVQYGTFDLGQSSEDLTKAQRDAEMLNKIEVLAKNGIQPSDELFSEFLRYTNDKQKEAGQYQQTAEELRASKFSGAQYYPTSRQRFAPNTEESFLENLRKENAKAEETFSQRSRFFGGEVAEGVRADKTRQGNELLDLEKEYQIIQSRDILKEAEIERDKSRNELAKEFEALQIRGLNYENEIADAKERQGYEQDNRILDLKKELELLESADEWKRREASYLEERLSLTQQLKETEDAIANSGRNDALELEVALAEQTLAYRREELEATIDIMTSRRDIARMDDYSANQTGAIILRHLAQQKTYSEAVADAWISVYESVNGFIGKGIDKLTKGNPIGEAAGGLLKFGVSSITTKLTTGLLDTFMPGLGSKFVESQNPVVAGLQKQDKQIDLLTQIARNTSGGGLGGGVSIPGFSGGGFSNPVSNLLGAWMNNTPASISSQTGITGLDGLFGPVGTAADGTRPRIVGQVPFGTAGNRSGFGGILSSIFGKGGFKGALSSLALAAPMLGLGLGAGLGKGSITGSILGGAGGLLGGGIAAAFLAPSLFGVGTAAGASPLMASMFGLLTNPFTIAAVPALLAGAYFLSRNSRRRKEEKTRTGFLNDAVGQFDKLIADVRSHRTSGPDALAQAEEIRKSYTEQANQLKDSKTRRIAMNEWNPPNKLWAKMEELKKVAESASADSERKNQLIPEFASGGVVRGRSGGMMAMIGEGGYDEYIFSTDPRYRNQSMAMLSDYLRQAQMPIPPQASSQVNQPERGAAVSQPVVNVSIDNISIDAEGMVRIAMTTDGVRREVVKTVNKAKKDGELI